MKRNPLGFYVTPENLYRAWEFRAAGIDVAEISLFASRESVEYALEQGGKVFDAVTDAGLDVWSVHLPTFGRWEIAAIDEDERRLAVHNQSFIVRAAVNWGAKVVVVHGIGENYEDVRLQQLATDAMRRSLDALRRCSGGVRIAVENLPRTAMGHSSNILKLMDSCDGICFDVNHLLLQSHNEFLDDLEKYVITTHLSDYDRGGDWGERHWKPGEKGGTVPWESVCKRLLRVGYRGPWMFETNLLEFPHYTAQEVVDGFFAHSRLERL